jgi:release factor glutamine methyltransferase
MQNPTPPSQAEWTILKLIQWAKNYFESHKIDSPRTTAEILLAYVLDIERIDLYLRFDQPLTGRELSKFKTVLKRRIKHEPVAYIVGSKEFWTLDLLVSRDVLIPRPESECLVEVALKSLAGDASQQTKRILELGTGSGAIILAMATEKPNNTYVATDLSLKALELARQNARRFELQQSVNFIFGDWFAPFDQQQCAFDIILTNPPYIKTSQVNQLQPEIFAYEPISALDGGADGLYCLKHIIEDAHYYLRPGGMLMLEIGHDQQRDVRRIAEKCGQYEHFRCSKDYGGYARVVQMRKKMLRTDI